MTPSFATAFKAASAAALAASFVMTSLPALADDAPQPCAIGTVTGVAGTPASLREYLALPESDRFRYLMANQITCKISDEGRASGCAGLTSLRHDRVSVYDDSDPTTTTVVARVDLDQGTFPIMVDTPKANLKCER